MTATTIDVEPVRALQDAVSEIRDRAAELDQQLDELCRRLHDDTLGNAGDLAEDLVDEAMRWADALEAGARMLDAISVAAANATAAGEPAHSAA